MFLIIIIVIVVVLGGVVGAFVTKEALERQRRIMQMKRFRRTSRNQKVDFSAEDKRTMI
jgi:hypothetical protein